jgi:hypothetical protein
MSVDAPLGALGVRNSAWSPELSAVLAGKSPTVLIGLIQGSPVSASLADTLATLMHDGALVQVLLVPEPGAAGGASAFASWVGQVLGLLNQVQLVEIGTASAPLAVSAATVAAYTVAGLATAQHAMSRPSTGVLWLDGGTASGDAATWSALESASAWPKSSFVARSLESVDSCSSPAEFAATLHQYPLTATLPLVSQALPGDAMSAMALAADSSCLVGSLGLDPSGSVAYGRLWVGPIPLG